MRRLTRLIAVLPALVLLLGTGLAAYADDGPASSPTPPSKPGDPFNGATLPPGDVFIVTPSDGATELGEPADPDAVQSQIAADASGSPAAGGSGSPTAGSTADPDGGGTADTADDGSDGSDGSGDPATPTAGAAEDGSSSGPAWWVFLVGAAALATLAGAGWRVRRGRGQPPEHDLEDGPPAA